MSNRYARQNPYSDRLPRLTSQAKVEAIATSSSSHWLRSNKAVDLWCLALCSCALTLLCHSLASAPQPQTSNYSVQSSSQSSAPISNAGSSLNLFTMPSSKPEIEEEESGKSG
ncbi:hypothetical protein H6G89_13570 [Oscillatoria sp. FACHB-1407]|uniref:hypothetical protein n=1 Tax=Oscillatoria sp. FACHB-1407 TaxID=2692847 RepID=UPI0016882D1E|nr:hypothetical protein [Oscillatoria sp. FACHB-1407]MBD2462078.1 hypothetical protein [Oscillatoria sp. FACHB-1407]